MFFIPPNFSIEVKDEKVIRLDSVRYWIAEKVSIFVIKKHEKHLVLTNFT